jgi:hypothetical protein
MRVSPRITLSLAALLASCGGTVNYDPASTNDPSPPAVNLLITRAGQPNLEVQARTTPAPPPVVGNYGNPAPSTRQQFSVLATATDNESGIRNIKLSITRTVCFTSSSGGVVQAYLGSVTRKEATYTDQRNAPRQASLGDTGLIDNSPFGTDPANLTAANLLTFTDANGTLRAGVGVSSRWNMEARNFSGQITYSNSIVVLAGNTSCVTQP